MPRNELTKEELRYYRRVSILIIFNGNKPSLLRIHQSVNCHKTLDTGGFSLYYKYINTKGNKS